MREIKFRFWNTNTNTFMKTIYNGLKNQIQEPYITAEGRIMVRTYSAIEDHGDEIFASQYTGIRDRKNRPIYEGDILKRVITVIVYGSGKPPSDVEEHLTVKYREEYAGFFVGETPLCQVVGSEHDLDTDCECTLPEIIGNIYENPELLEGEKDAPSRQ